MLTFFLMFQEPDEDPFDVSMHFFNEVYLNPLRQQNAMKQSPLLYPGAKISVVEALVHMFDWFTSHPSLSKQAFSENLHYLHNYILPQGNLLPSSYQEAYQVIKPFLIPEITYHVCPNDCIIFRKEYKNAAKCPKCLENRFKSNSHLPKRTFIYLPLCPRLVRSYGTASIAEALQSHQENMSDENRNTLLRDIHDSPLWKKAYSQDGTCQGDPRGLSLSLCLDGLNPWSKNKTNYSMWPIVLGQLNLPRSIRNLFSNLLLVGIIPAQEDGKEPYHLDPYLEILVDELLCLTDMKMYDAYRKESFPIKVGILLHVLDYQGIGKVFHMTGTGSYRGCSWCQVKGMYCSHLKKIIYLGNRRYLAPENEMRKDIVNFPEKTRENRAEPPARKFNEDLNYHKAYANAKNQSQAKSIASATGCRGEYIFATKLPNFDRVTDVVPDAMHTLAVCMKHILYLITGKEPEDSVSVRNAEKSFNRFPECWIEKEANEDTDLVSDKNVAERSRTILRGKKALGKGKKGRVKSSSTPRKLPSAPFTLKPGDVKIADQRARQVIVPSDCSFKSGPVFSKLSRLNSHDLKEVC
ncbi:uncharacterized protein [Montipora capricornis]|uniref:uncharacterized protein n=1 Tax=Montipora capricornis TaxID=246305 RepID=UPI0035F123B2